MESLDLNRFEPKIPILISLFNLFFQLLTLSPFWISKIASTQIILVRAIREYKFIIMSKGILINMESAAGEAFFYVAVFAQIIEEKYELINVRIGSRILRN
jgi:hypothetical protein